MASDAQPTRRAAMQFVRFALVGCAGTACHYALLIALVRWAGLPVVLSSTAGAVLGASVNYVLNRQFTFDSARSHGHAVPRFAAIAVIALAINAVVMAVLQHLGLHYLVAQVVATVLVLFFGFAANRSWTFAAR